MSYNSIPNMQEALELISDKLITPTEMLSIMEEATGARLSTNYQWEARKLGLTLVRVGGRPFFWRYEVEARAEKLRLGRPEEVPGFIYKLQRARPTGVV